MAAARGVDPPRAAVLSGCSQLGYLRHSLHSPAAGWSRPRELTVVGDGSPDDAPIRTALIFWARTFRVKTPDWVVKRACRSGVPPRERVVRAFVFDLAITVVTTFAAERTTLSVDTDILFMDFFLVPARLGEETHTVLLKASRECQRAHDSNVVGTPGPLLDASSFVCAGMFYLRGNLFGSVDLRAGLAIAAERHRYFGERTLVAAVASPLGGTTWPGDVTASSQGDAQSLAITYRGRPWHARHCVDPVRHLFRRDALALRLGVRRAP